MRYRKQNRNCPRINFFGIIVVHSPEKKRLMSKKQEQCNLFTVGKIKKVGCRKRRKITIYFPDCPVLPKYINKEGLKLFMLGWLI